MTRGKCGKQLKGAQGESAMIRTSTVNSGQKMKATRADNFLLVKITADRSFRDFSSTITKAKNIVQFCTKGFSSVSERPVLWATCGTS